MIVTGGLRKTRRELPARWTYVRSRPSNTLCRVNVAACRALDCIRLLRIGDAMRVLVLSLLSSAILLLSGCAANPDPIIDTKGEDPETMAFPDRIAPLGL